MYDHQNAKRYLAKDLLIYANYISTKKQYDEALIIIEKSRQYSLSNVAIIKATEEIEKKIRIAKANLIQEIINELSMGTLPNKQNEVERIRKVCQQGKMQKLKTVKIDLYLESKDNEMYLFDLKTAKPNISGFKDHKRTLLEWIAIILAQNPTAKINSYIAIPYNPYYPEPYQRWTLNGMLDLPQELKVAEEFWDYLGGENAYNDLLNCFELAGLEMQTEINNYFSKFKQ